MHALMKLTNVDSARYLAWYSLEKTADRSQYVQHSEANALQWISCRIIAGSLYIADWPGNSLMFLHKYQYTAAWHNLWARREIAVGQLMSLLGRYPQSTLTNLCTYKQTNKQPCPYFSLRRNKRFLQKFRQDKNFSKTSYFGGVFYYWIIWVMNWANKQLKLLKTINIINFFLS